MDTGIDLKTLHPLEVRVLLAFDPKSEITPESVTKSVGFNIGQCNQALSWLEAKTLIAETDRRTITEFEITDLGREYADRGTPEERILDHLEKSGPTAIPGLAEALSLENKDNSWSARKFRRNLNVLSLQPRRFTMTESRGNAVVSQFMESMIGLWRFSFRNVLAGLLSSAKDVMMFAST